MNDTLRAFIAVKIATPEPLQRLLGEFRNIGRPVKAVADDQLHLTLKFLGDIRRDRTDEIARLLTDVCSHRPPFRMTLCGVGAFPRLERPSVIWAGFTDAEPLIAIANELERECESLGYTKEQRPFHPHLTLARVRTSNRRRRSVPLPPKLDDLMRQHETSEFGDVDVDRIVLFRSRLNSDGPQYTELAATNLRVKG